jgi:hypothetical protein
VNTLGWEREGHRHEVVRVAVHVAQQPNVPQQQVLRGAR